MCRVLAIVDKCVYSNYITATITTNKETKDEHPKDNQHKDWLDQNSKRRIHTRERPQGKEDFSRLGCQWPEQKRWFRLLCDVGSDGRSRKNASRICWEVRWKTKMNVEPWWSTDRQAISQHWKMRFFSTEHMSNAEKFFGMYVCGDWGFLCVC